MKKFMSNMSYCRFENTASDLLDCLEALDAGIAEHGTIDAFKETLSSREEQHALENFLIFCRQVVELEDAE
jgi:hypothetical protein